MIGLFKKKSTSDKLRTKFQKLMEEAYSLSKINRTLSDQKYAEAHELQKQIDELESEGK